MKFFVTDISAPKRASLQILYTPSEVGVYCVKENHDAEIYFAFFLPFSIFSISQSNVVHTEIYIKGFLKKLKD